ncbi:AAA family ATPase [bacterium]|nr:AAA family ATPase [bacterium]
MNETARATVGPSVDGAFLEGGRKGVYGHFQLKEAPFRDAVNPRFLFRTRQAERAYLQLKMYLEDKGALALVTGRSGAGKSLFMQCLLEELSQSDEFRPIALFATPDMSLTGLLYEILYELDAEMPGFRRQAMLEQLHEKIMEEAAAGRRVVILLDEAHFLSSSALHLLRTLTNLESPEEKLCTLVLFAEEGFVARLKHKSCRRSPAASAATCRRCRWTATRRSSTSSSGCWWPGAGDAVHQGGVRGGVSAYGRRSAPGIAAGGGCDAGGVPGRRARGGQRAGATGAGAPTAMKPPRLTRTGLRCAPMPPASRAAGISAGADLRPRHARRRGHPLAGSRASFPTPGNSA